MSDQNVDSPQEDMEQRTYIKIKALYKCSGEKCNNKWVSFHAWQRKDKVLCPDCNKVAEIDRFRDEMCDLDNYYCPNETCDGHHWQSIHNGNAEACRLCNTVVSPDGTQKRHGRRTYFICTNATCMKSWEEYSADARTQRCRNKKCGSRGDVEETIKYKFKKQEEEEEEEEKAIPGMSFRGRHDYSNCDMCRDLRNQGRRISCIKARKVVCKAKKGEGASSEIIVQVDMMRNLKLN